MFIYCPHGHPVYSKPFVIFYDSEGVALRGNSDGVRKITDYQSSINSMLLRSKGEALKMYW